MKINKRACRKYAIPNLKFNLNNGLLYTQAVKFVIRTAVKNIGRRRILLLYIFFREDIAKNSPIPKYTVFQARDEYITLEQKEDGTTKWRKAMFAKLGPWYDPISFKSAFYSKTDETRVLCFCKQNTESGIQSINFLQEMIFEAECLRKKKKREKAIRSRMANVGRIPQSMINWTRKEALPAYIFYEYQRDRNKQNGYCTFCHKVSYVPKARHQLPGICPNCGKVITYRALGRSTRVYDRTTIQMIQRIGDDLLIRICKADISYWDYKNPRFSFRENMRIFVNCTNNGIICQKPYHFSYNHGITTHWTPGDYPMSHLWGYHFEADQCGHLYSRNLDKALYGTPWQYCQIGEFYQGCHKPLEILPYLSAYLRYPAIEYLVKLHLYSITSDVVYRPEKRQYLNFNGRNPREVLQIPPSDLPILCEAEADISGLCLLRKADTEGIRITANTLRWIRENAISSHDDLLFCLHHMTAHKLFRYLSEQHCQLKRVVSPTGYQRYASINQVFSEYKDYLRFCEELGYDMKNSFILFPKNLKDAHDHAMELFDKEKNKIYNKKIRKAFRGLYERYHFQKYGLSLIPPRNSQEIITEGQTLHHCVGTYIPNIAKGNSTILFIRHTKSPKKPFYTIELKDGQIIQIRGMYNCIPTPKVQKFLKAWELSQNQQQFKKAA